MTLPGEAAKIQTDSEASLIEVGLGIHGETGRKKIPMAKSAYLAEVALNDYVLGPVDSAEAIDG